VQGTSAYRSIVLVRCMKAGEEGAGPGTVKNTSVLGFRRLIRAAKRLVSLSGSRTQLSRVTGACTNRYTNRDATTSAVFWLPLGAAPPKERKPLGSPFTHEWPLGR
jgi:hypothetical protein